MSIAARIRAFREAAGVTQAELGRRLGVGQSAVQKWEAGTRDLSVTDLERLADAIGLSPALFVAGRADAVVYAAKLNAVADMQDALAALSRRYASEATGAKEVVYPLAASAQKVADAPATPTIRDAALAGARGTGEAKGKASATKSTRRAKDG